MKFAFIVSSGRTGTQFLAHYLDGNFAEVRALHEPPPSRLLRLAAHAHVAGWLGEAALAGLLRRVRRSALQSPAREPGLRWRVESNPVLASFVPVLGHVFDDPLVVHIVRDPRDTVRSAMNHGLASGLKGAANRWVPFWYPDVERLAGVTLPVRVRGGADEWPLRAALHWRGFNDRIEGAARDERVRYLRLRYEHLFDPERSDLRLLTAALELPYPEDEGRLRVSPSERHNQGRLDALPPWREWSPEFARAFDALVGDAMRRFGYGREPEWTARAATGADAGS